MTKKKDPNLSKREALILAWKNRKDYKGYDRTPGSLFYIWRSITNTKKGILKGFPDSWRKYEGFVNDLPEGWIRGQVLCRIDDTKPYSKDNVEWRDKTQTGLNRLIKLEYNGEVKTLVEWSAELGLNYNGVRQRYFKLKINRTPERILFGKTYKTKRDIHDIRSLAKDSEKHIKAIKMLGAYRTRDRKRSFEFNIDTKWFEDQLTNGKCYYCGDTKNLGLDRIDNSKGHTMDNVLVCCYDCNVCRQDRFTVEEFVNIVHVIRKIKKERRKHENNSKRTKT